MVDTIRHLVHRYSGLSNNRTVWNKRTGETNSQKLINAQDEITAQGKLLNNMYTQVGKKLKKSAHRKKNKRTVSNKSAQGKKNIENNKRTVCVY